MYVVHILIDSCLNKPARCLIEGKNKHILVFLSALKHSVAEPRYLYLVS